MINELCSNPMIFDHNIFAKTSMANWRVQLQKLESNSTIRRNVMVEVSDALSRSKELEQQILSSLESGRPDELAVSSSS